MWKDKKELFHRYRSTAWAEERLPVPLLLLQP